MEWLSQGAQPTERVQKLLEVSGAWSTFKISRGEIHTVGGSAPAPVAEARRDEQPRLPLGSVPARHH